MAFNPELGRTTTPEIFLDNVKRADELVNGPAGTVNDRAGEPLDTWRQMMAKNDEVRQNIIPLSKQYQTLEAAQADIANIPVGSTTYYRSPDDSALAIEVMNVGGTLQPTGRKMISEIGVNEKILDRLPDVSSSVNKVPLFNDEDDNVPVWLENGKLNAVALDDNLRDVSDTSFPGKVPLFHDDEGNVPVWLEDGKLNAVALHEGLLAGVLTNDEFNSAMQKRVLNTTGATAWKFRAKKSKLELSLPSKLKIGFTGDSWTEHNTIPQVFADYFYSKYGKSGDGWIQLNIDNPNQINGIVLNRNGWAVYDASGNAAPAFPTAMDGMYIYTNTTTSTLTLSNLYSSSVQIFYYDNNGAFRYSLNGGTPVIVTGSGTNKIVSVTISGLDVSVATTISIDSAVNAGTVVIYGFYSEGTGNGVEINKMGNGGITAPQYIKTLPFLSQTGAVVAPDLLIMIIGTNDFRTSVTLQAFRDSLSSWIEAWKAIIPDSSIIMVAPPQCNASGANPLSSFRDVMRDVAINKGVEFYSMYDFMNTSYAKSNAQGLWKDNLHLSNVGARFLLNQLNKYFLEQ
ncbi:flagellar biosynthesis%2C cell-distal portion of basal-body rod [Klebsiella pneumoniae]|uniref:GDSL-type esterase/lipase family protein n=1 Tax=Klebsiella pneumoniae TaxID=573 RepID=UPI0008028D65|nr:GDSL-type esterase/lipase family protein [Klebsiella pneumoniae]SBG50141.1 flagellar biosynthesis%2C cell-distal portion of basal-body rod [Klebsiella pneumoniae]